MEYFQKFKNVTTNKIYIFNYTQLYQSYISKSTFRLILMLLIYLNIQIYYYLFEILNVLH